MVHSLPAILKKCGGGLIVHEFWKGVWEIYNIIDFGKNGSLQIRFQGE